MFISLKGGNALLKERCSLGQGRYIFKLLAIDVPTAEGPEQRVYLSGDDAIYNRGLGMLP